MVTNRDALKHWYHSRIRETHREAYRLSLEVGLEAQDKDDLAALEKTVEQLDDAVKTLERARLDLVTA